MKKEQLKELDITGLKNYGESYNVLISFLLENNQDIVKEYINLIAKQTDSSNLWKLKNKVQNAQKKHTKKNGKKNTIKNA